MSVARARARLGYLKPWRVAAGSGLSLRHQTSLVSTTASPGVKGVWSVAPKLFESERRFVVVSQSVKAVGIGGGVQAVHVNCGCSVKPESIHAVHVVALTSGEAAFSSIRWRLGGDGTSSDREPTHSAPSSACNPAHAIQRMSHAPAEIHSAPSSDLQRMQSSELHHSCADTRAGRLQACCGRDGKYRCIWPLRQSVSRPRA